MRMRLRMNLVNDVKFDNVKHIPLTDSETCLCNIIHQTLSRFSRVIGETGLRDTRKW